MLGGRYLHTQKREHLLLFGPLTIVNDHLDAQRLAQFDCLFAEAGRRQEVGWHLLQTSHCVLVVRDLRSCDPGLHILRIRLIGQDELNRFAFKTFALELIEAPVAFLKERKRELEKLVSFTILGDPVTY